MKTFLQYIKPYWKWVLLTIVFIALQSLSDLYLPALNAKIIDDGVMTGDVGKILTYGVLMLIVAILVGLCTLGTTYYSTKASLAYGRDMRLGLFTKVQSFSQSDLDQFGTPGAFAPLGNFELAAAAVKAARKKGFRCVAGNVLSSDTFYDDDPDFLKKWQRMGVLAVEMETAALYANAARAGKRALGIFTVSDCPFKGLATTAEQRQTAFTGMVETALELLNG